MSEREGLFSNCKRRLLGLRLTLVNCCFFLLIIMLFLLCCGCLCVSLQDTCRSCCVYVVEWFTRVGSLSGCMSAFLQIKQTTWGVLFDQKLFQTSPCFCLQFFFSRTDFQFCRSQVYCHRSSRAKKTFALLRASFFFVINSIDNNLKQ